MGFMGRLFGKKLEEGRVRTRAFWSWSLDGRHVLLVDLKDDSGQLTDPMRVSVWGVEDGKPNREVWSFAGAEGQGPEACVAVLSAKGFAPVDAEAPPPNFVGSPQGRDVELIAGNWRTCLTGRESRFRSSGVIAFIAPDARRAFAMPDERVVTIEPTVSFDFPPGWRRVAMSSVLSYQTEHFGEALFQVVVEHKVGDQYATDTRSVTQLLGDYAKTWGDTEGTISEAVAPFGALAMGRFASGTYAWLLESRQARVSVTFISPTSMSDDDVALIDGIVRSCTLTHTLKQ